MDKSISAIHEEVFLFLKGEADKNVAFRFTLRKSDKENRLSKGYWFYGNEWYVALSFWSGTDWKNKTPNIIFVIRAEDYSCYLEIATSDSTKKLEFVKRFLLLPELGIEYKNGKYCKYFEGDDYMASLRSFIMKEKIIIDRIIKENADFFTDLETDNKIGFIDKETFDYRISKTNKYRQNLQLNRVDEYPCYIKEIRIKKYAGIIDLNIEGLPNNTQWIFLTGANGSGKTSILRALTLALCPNVTEHLALEEPGHFEIHVDLHKGSETIEIDSTAQTLPNRKDYVTKGFAAYGPSRLTIDDPETRTKISAKELRKRSRPAYSIFHADGILYEFSQRIERLIEQSSDIKIKDKLEIIIESLIEFIGPIENIYVTREKNANDIIEAKTLYVEKDVLGNKFEPVKYFQLSSGIRSLIAMVGDMMIRLFEEQPDIYDIGELKGIVLVDEIDIHFHPEQQRNLVELFAKSFPKVQFVVTTHSPVPLLGAPSGSVFINVKRLAKKGVLADRLLDLEKEIKNLLPNAIYSSDLFDFEEIVSASNEDEQEIITEDNYKEIKLQEKIKNQLEFLKNNDDDFLKEIGIKK